MGWTGEKASRNEIVKRERGPHAYSSKRFNTEVVATAIATHRSADEDWFLYEVRAAADGRILYTFIEVMVWDQGMHKEISEECGPYYYGCPVSWLDRAPMPAGEYAAKWRQEIRNLAALKKVNQAYRQIRMFEIA